ncbi:hypothetical protein BRADI_5g04704v3 [Brachypodium distachyon]|uniref:Reverse transcriptase zinc-binding domain-containing protein n=1 Tax=Brachypodium distachyon TaxID=15368 RepID=A0A2K2CFH7_BRADI|nr:hypothetical protein BRADI_5g04704v3 [Brachypodium distachyon]
MKLERGDTGLSCELLRWKYLGDRGLHAVKNWFTVGSAYTVGNGKHTFFWSDVWLRQAPLDVVFHRLFSCSNQQEATVAEVLVGGDIRLTFRPSFGDEEAEEWELLVTLLREVELSEVPDSARWELTPNKTFSTKSMYDALSHSGVCDLQDTWKATIPLKQQIFNWMCLKGRIQVTEELHKKGWQDYIQSRGVSGSLEESPSGKDASSYA